MKASILAAGRGNRMQPLTNTTPKPLLQVGGKPLIVHHLERLSSAGFEEIIINTGWLGDQLPQVLDKGQKWGLKIQYSHEGWPALETAGGIKKALPLLDDEPFLVVNGDVWCEMNFGPLKSIHTQGAHLILVNNPEHNLDGDFSLMENNCIAIDGEETFTYSGVGVYHPSMFDAVENHPTPLGPLLRESAAKGLLTGEVFTGRWTDVGTPERLAVLEHQWNQLGDDL